MKTVNIFNSEILNKFKVKIRYVQVLCPECLHAWGYYLNESEEIDVNALVCRECSKQDRLNNILK